MVNYVNAYNKLVPMLNKLSKDNFDIWVNEPRYQGYGFKVIFEKVWVEVGIDQEQISFKTIEELLEKEKNRKAIYRVNVYEKLKEHPNYLDSFIAKELNSFETTNIQELENFIRQVA